MIIKKITITLLAILLTFTLFGCRDKKAYNNLFTVIFYSENDSTTITSTYIESIFDVEEGSKVERPEDPVANGLNFLGWYKEKAGINPWDFDTDVVTSSVVLYAKWETEVFTITYVFDSLGGQLTDTPVTQYTVFQDFSLPKASRIGGLFQGWILTPTSEYKVGDTILKTTAGRYEDLVLYALFRNAEYTVSFDENLAGATKPKMHSIQYGQTINFPEAVDPSGKMKFVGWYSKSGADGDWGYHYAQGSIFYGAATGINPDTGEWEFAPRNTKFFARWEEA